MKATEVEDVVRSVLRHYGVGATVGRVTLQGRDWHVEVVDTYKTATNIVISNDTAQGVRRAIVAAFDLDG